MKKLLISLILTFLTTPVWSAWQQTLKVIPDTTTWRYEWRYRGQVGVGDDITTVKAYMRYDGLIEGTTVEATTGFVCPDGTVMTSTSTFEPVRTTKYYNVVIASGSWGGEIISLDQSPYAIKLSSITAQTQAGGSNWVVDFFYAGEDDAWGASSSTDCLTGTITVSSRTVCGASGFIVTDIPADKQQYLKVNTAGSLPMKLRVKYEIK